MLGAPKKYPAKPGMEISSEDLVYFFCRYLRNAAI